MDLGVREWMIIIGVLLIVAVVLDGYRRVRNERRGRIKVAVSRQVKRAARRSEPSIADDEPPVDGNPELPNGGARPARRTQGRNVPVLMDPVDVPEPKEPEQQHAPLRQAEEQQTQENWHWADEDEDLSRYDDEPGQSAAVTAGATEPEQWHEELTPEKHFYDADADDRSNHFDHFDAEPEPEPEPEPESVASRDLSARAERSSRDMQRRDEPQEQQAAPAQEILVLYVISKDKKGFKGQDLLQLLLACDVRYGKNNIFHRYEEAKGRGAVQFSVANLVEPGTFDLDRMDQLVTPGLCFFMTLPGPVKSITAFNYMVETAQVLVKNLGGELRDEAQSVVTQQTLEHCRQRIRDFERRQLTLHL